MSNGFPDIQFKGALRTSQAIAVEVAKSQLEAGERRLHIVAPPGSGKTVMGLYIWAHCVKAHALVLSPNSAIQSQWAKRMDLFDLPGGDHRISTDPANPGVLTSLTYQSVTLPERGGEAFDDSAIALWESKLIEKGHAENPDEASAWIYDLQISNPTYFETRLSAYRKQVRDEMAMGGEALETLHASSLSTLNRLKAHGVGMIILDECHHLMGHWGRVLADASELLDGPVILGLTATPPDRKGKPQVDIERYETFFGDIDFEVPVPALVKEGHLSPYQDLAYFIRPNAQELKFIAEADEKFEALVKQLCEPADDPERTLSLPNWVYDVLGRFALPTGEVKDWVAFYRRDPLFADMGRLYLHECDIGLPETVPSVGPALLNEPPPRLAMLIPVLDRYIRHGLRRSQHELDHALAEQVIRQLRILGYQVTETGTQGCASPVSRVMAYAAEKTAATLAILKEEAKALGENIRAIVVTDYEKTAAMREDVEDLLDEEAGGAIAAYRALISDEETDALDPILVTGSTVLVDDDLLDVFMDQAKAWLNKRGHEVELSEEPVLGFHVIKGKGADWCPRVYVSMITDLFQAGLTRCLVGTRGLLGEGWDAHRVNVLIDLTTVTTSMSVNQLRGRSIRLDPDQKEKVADNWDVICVAGEFSKGLDDYQRFIDKHKTLYGVTDDGAVEKGVGHVHAAFTELKPEGVEGALSVMNTEMLNRVHKRAWCKALWRIGEPYKGLPIAAVEIKSKSAFGGFPMVSGQDDPWTMSSLALAIGKAVLESLREAELIDYEARIHTGERSGGYVRVFVQGASEENQSLFSECMREIFGPLDRPRYVIRRYVTQIEETFLSKLLPEIVGQYFRKRKRAFAMLHAVPSVLAKNKDLVGIFERHWEMHVSPGKAIYAHHGEGEKIVADAKENGISPNMHLHEKEVFM